MLNKSAAQHKRQLELVLCELRAQHVLIKPSKCVWGQTELCCSDHMIGRDGMKPDPNTVQAVQDWPAPTCWRKVLQVLGLTSYLISKFQGCDSLTKPATDLSKRDVLFDWTPSCI